MITSDNDRSVSLSVAILTNYVGSVRCVVHTLALCVNDVLSDDVRVHGRSQQCHEVLKSSQQRYAIRETDG